MDTQNTAYHSEPVLQHKKKPVNANDESNFAAREPAFQHKRRVELIAMSQTDRTQEPPLQRKKRSQSASPVRSGLGEPPIPRRKKSTESRPISAFGTYFTEPEDHSVPRKEFVLLGDQSKFASNVVYHVRSKAALQNEMIRKEAATQAESVERLSIPAARRVVVDTGKPTRSASKSAGELPQQEVRPRQENRLKDAADVRQISRQQYSDDDSRTVSSIIPPTPMAPRGPVPRLVIDDRTSTSVQTDFQKRSQPLADDSRRPYGNRGHSEVGTKLNGPVPRSRQRDPGGDGKLIAAGKPSRSRSEYIIKPTVKTQAVQCTEFNERDWQAVDRKQTALGRDVDEKLNVAMSDNRRKIQPKQTVVNVTNTEKGNVNNSSPVKTTGKNQAAGKQIQTGVTDQQQKLVQHDHASEQNNYAVKYRIGLVPQRSRTGPTRKSEYQQQFQWRSFERTSPLMAAQEVVYRSHPDLTSFKLGRVAEEDSEYRSQFQPWTALSAREEREVRAVEPQKIKRSKSLKELKPVRAAGLPSHSYSDEEDVRHYKEDGVGDVEASSDIVRRPSINVAANHNNFYPRQSQSEYASNFKPPWKLVNKEKKQHGSPDHQPPVAADWYAGVLELRRNAQEYRQRAFGTHFSREHLAQLSARNAQLWDTVSNSSLASEPLQPKNYMAAAADVKKSSAESVDSYSVDGSVEQDDRVPVTNGTKRMHSSDARKHQHRHQTQQQQRFYDDNSVSDNLSVDQMSDVINTTEQATAGDDDDDELENDIAAWRGEQQPERYRGADVKPKKIRQEMINSRHNVIVPVKSLHQQKRQPSTRDAQTLADATNLQSHGHEPRTNKRKSLKRDVGVGSYDVADSLSSGMSTSRSLESSCSLANEVLVRARSRRDHFWK